MKNIAIALILLLSLVFASSCVQKGGESGGNDSGDVIKVGVYVDLSGQTSSYGQSTKKGIELATEEINKAGGVNGKQLKLFIEDDQGRPEQAKTVVSKLINQDKVNVVLGEVASTNTLAAAPVAQEAKIPMITPSSTNPKVTQIGDHIFRICFKDDFQGSSMAKFAAKKLNAKTAAIFGDVNSDYSKGLTNFFTKEFEKQGGRVIDNQAYTQNDTDFKSQLTNIRGKNPDVLYIPGYYGEVGIIVKQARELNMTMPIIGGDGWDSPELWRLGGAALKNSYITNHYSVDDPMEHVQSFVKAFKARHSGENPDAIAALAYDAAKLMADAIKRAGGTESQKLRDAIANTKDFKGVTGNITINENRDADKPAIVMDLKPDTKQFVPTARVQVDGTVADAKDEPAEEPKADAKAANANTVEKPSDDKDDDKKSKEKPEDKTEEKVDEKKDEKSADADGN